MVGAFSALTSRPTTNAAGPPSGLLPGPSTLKGSTVLVFGGSGGIGKAVAIAASAAGAREVRNRSIA